MTVAGRVTSEEAAEVKALKRENAELRRANGILKAASALFAAELDGHSVDRGLCSRGPGRRDSGGLMWGVESICAVLRHELQLQIAPSSFYDNVGRTPAKRDSAMSS